MKNLQQQGVHVLTIAGGINLSMESNNYALSHKRSNSSHPTAVISPKIREHKLGLVMTKQLKN